MIMLMLRVMIFGEIMWPDWDSKTDCGGYVPPTKKQKKLKDYFKTPNGGRPAEGLKSPDDIPGTSGYISCCAVLVSKDISQTI